MADRDEKSKLDDVTWGSYLKTGTLTLHSDGTISVKWDKEMVTLKSHISEKGRGVELSELIVFNGKLYTVDDRSGIGKFAVVPGHTQLLLLMHWECVVWYVGILRVMTVHLSLSGSY